MSPELDFPNPYELLARNRARTPSRPALTTPDAQYTYENFLQIVDRYAETLLASGFEAGMKVIVMAKPGIELYALAFALFKVHGVPVIVDPGMGLKRILESYRRVEAQVFIGIPITQVIRRLARKSFASITLAYTIDKERLTPLHKKVSKPYPVPVPIHAEDLAFVTFTTGSTGPAKAVEASYGMLSAAVQIIEKQFEQGANEKDLVSMPFFGLISLLIGSEVVIPKMNPGKPAEIDPAIIAKTIEQHKITSMLASPAFYDRLSSYCQSNRVKLTSLRIVSCGGAPMTLDIMKRTQAMLSQDAKFYVCWGATEGLPLSYISVPEVLKMEHDTIDAGNGSPLGYPVSGVELEIIAMTGDLAPSWPERSPRPQGQWGEIIAHGANVSRSYYKNAKANLEHKLVDERGRVWHRTGDLGYFDSKNRLIFLGRMAHLVCSNESLLHSVALEGLFNSHPKVKRSALVQGKDGPAIIIEPIPNLSKRGEQDLKDSILKDLSSNPQTKDIREIYLHPGFPVDPRHNAKIERLKLSAWVRHQVQIYHHIPKLIPIFGWLFLIYGFLYPLSGFWLWAWYIDIFLSTIAHIVQIPKAFEVTQAYGYSRASTIFWTLIFGATYWKPLDLSQTLQKGAP